MPTALAAGSATPPFDGIDNGQKLMYLYGTITPSGAYATGGDVLDFTKLNDLIKSGYIPVQVTIQSQSTANGHSGYIYYYRPGTTLANGKMQVMATGNGNGLVLAELAAGAYPAAILADTIVFCAIFMRL